MNSRRSDNLRKRYQKFLSTNVQIEVIMVSEFYSVFVNFIIGGNMRLVTCSVFPDDELRCRVSVAVDR